MTPCRHDADTLLTACLHNADNMLTPCRYHADNVLTLTLCWHHADTLQMHCSYHVDSILAPSLLSHQILFCSLFQPMDSPFITTKLFTFIVIVNRKHIACGNCNNFPLLVYAVRCVSVYHVYFIMTHCLLFMLAS